MRKKDVIDLFDSISPRYDISNTVLSMGLEIFWRKRFLKNISRSYKSILDVCCGSGTSTFQISKKAKKAKVYGIDFSGGMIKIARERYKDKNKLVFYKSDVSSLDFKDNSFECTSIVFGIRNILDREKALKEFYRVTKKTGRIVILEFNHIKSGFFGHLFRFYLRKIMPVIGGIITGNRDAYEYLTETINEFPEPFSFKKLMENAGWRSVKHFPLTGGICSIFTGYKI